LIAGGGLSWFNAFSTGDARMHDEVAALGGIDQLFRRDPPRLGGGHALRERGDMVSGIPKRDEPRACRQIYGIVEAAS